MRPVSINLCASCLTFITLYAQPNPPPLQMEQKTQGFGSVNLAGIHGGSVAVTINNLTLPVRSRAEQAARSETKRENVLSDDIELGEALSGIQHTAQLII